MKRVLLSLMCLCMPLPAMAHKVIMAVFPSGNAIEGELGLSNGTMAIAQTIIITDDTGTELGRTQTDENGFFIYTPTQATAHNFYANMGAGHIGRVEMSALDVADIMGVAPSAPTTVATEGPTTTGAAPLSADVKGEIAEMIRDEIRPLRREIAASREHANVQSILGGIGYILGLFGLGFYIAARRKLGQ